MRIPRRQRRLVPTTMLRSHLCRPAQAIRELGARLNESNEHSYSLRVAGCRVRDAARHTDARPAAPIMCTCRLSARADSSWCENTRSEVKHTTRGIRGTGTRE